MKLELSVDELKKLVNKKKESIPCNCKSLDIEWYENKIGVLEDRISEHERINKRALEEMDKLKNKDKTCIICGSTEFKEIEFEAGHIYNNKKYEFMYYDYECTKCKFNDYSYTKLYKKEV